MLYTVSTETTNNSIAGRNFTIGRKNGHWQSSGENEARKIHGVTLHFQNSSWPAFRVRENKHAKIRYINPESKYENVFMPTVLVQANNTNSDSLFALFKLFQWHTWYTSSFGRLVTVRTMCHFDRKVEVLFGRPKEDWLAFCSISGCSQCLLPKSEGTSESFWNHDLDHTKRWKFFCHTLLLLSSRSPWILICL